MGSIDPKDLPIESTFYYNERSALFIYTVLFDAYFPLNHKFGVILFIVNPPLNLYHKKAKLMIMK